MGGVFCLFVCLLLAFCLFVSLCFLFCFIVIKISFDPRKTNLALSQTPIPRPNASNNNQQFAFSPLLYFIFYYFLYIKYLLFVNLSL